MSHIFISYARKDVFFVDRLRDDLQEQHIPYWIDSEGLSPGTFSWEKSIRQAIKDSSAVLWVVSPASYDSPYVRDEIAIARLYKRKIYPVWADGDSWLECVPLGTGEIQYADMRHGRYANGWAELLAALRGEQSELALPEEAVPVLAVGMEPRNPYKGLNAFTEADAADFFGRESLIELLHQALAERLAPNRDRFLAVLGPSGAGKSSVVMAGLIPALKRGGLDGSAKWVYLPHMVPGAHPVEALSEALYSQMPNKSLSSIEADLNSSGGRYLHRLAKQIPAERVVLYIDQFEEVFTHTQDESERQQFIDLLTYAASEPDGAMVILLSMRADFYGHPMNYPQLGGLINTNHLSVLPMTISDLRDAIEKPARLPEVGLTFDPDLVADIVFALRDRDLALAGALPLLQFTLERLYAERQRTHLTRAAYDAMGGVQGAVGTHCETVFTDLEKPVQAALPRVFLPLVNIDEDSGEATRRRAKYTEVVRDGDAEKLVTALVKERLLVAGQERSGDPYLEIAHEALLKSWGRLAEWIVQAKDDLRLLHRTERDALEWERAGKLDFMRPNAEQIKRIEEACQRLGMTVNDPLLEDFLEPEQTRLLRELDNPNTSHQRRYYIGDRLSMIGDPREGIGVRADGTPDILWLPVTPGGEITIEGEHFTLQPFYIAKYLVTYRQFQAFVEAEDGFEDDRWWAGMPKDYQKQPLGSPPSQQSNYPRSTVSWYQSVAFARWLNHRLIGLELPTPSGNNPPFVIGRNAEIRLPTEWEWQWAAQAGAEAREYPWGAWDNYPRANTTEAGINDRSTAVGMYPQGAGVCGAMDMSGNLWEWCLNKYNEVRVTTLDNSNSYRTVRGGSIYYIQNRRCLRLSLLQ